MQTSVAAEENCNGALVVGSCRGGGVFHATGKKELHNDKGARLILRQIRTLHRGFILSNAGGKAKFYKMKTLIACSNYV